MIQPDKTPELGRVLEQHFNPLVTQIRHSWLAIVAAVNGPCAGAAVGTALAADIVCAARSAYFYELFPSIALVPDGGNTQFRAHSLGLVRASGIMLLGDRIAAAEAWGLVWRAAEADRLEGEVDRVTARLAALSPTAIAATKRLIRSDIEFCRGAQLALERDF